MDIMYGNCLYVLLIVDVSTWYCWIFVMSSLTSLTIVEALESFQAAAGGIDKTFHKGFDKRLIGGKAL